MSSAFLSRCKLATDPDARVDVDRHGYLVLVLASFDDGDEGVEVDVQYRLGDEGVDHNSLTICGPYTHEYALELERLVERAGRDVTDAADFAWSCEVESMLISQCAE